MRIISAERDVLVPHFVFIYELLVTREEESIKLKFVCCGYTVK
jgi:hypothetical protein